MGRDWDTKSTPQQEQSVDKALESAVADEKEDDNTKKPSWVG